MYKNYFFLAFCILLALYFAPLSISAVAQLTIGVSRAFCVNNGTPLHLELKFNTPSMTGKPRLFPSLISCPSFLHSPHCSPFWPILFPQIWWIILALGLCTCCSHCLVWSLNTFYLSSLTHVHSLALCLRDPLPKLSLCPIVSIKYPCPFSKLPVLFLQGTFQFVNLYLLCNNVFDNHLPSYKVVSFISGRTLSFILSITTLLHLAHVV